MSLTKQQFLAAAKGDYKVVDVDGFGQIGVRSCPQLQFSLRITSYRDPVTQKVIPEEAAKADVHRIIDQVMVNETTPMFTDEDIDTLQGLSSSKLGPLLEALEEASDQKKQSGESKPT